MKIYTRGFLNNDVTRDDIFNFLKENLGERVFVNEHFFRYINENGEFFVYYFGNQYLKEELCIYVSAINFDFNDFNAKMIKKIVEHFGGWYQEFDCDEDMIYFERGENVKVGDVSVLSKVYDIVGDMECAKRIVENKEKIEWVLKNG